MAYPCSVNCCLNVVERCVEKYKQAKENGEGPDGMCFESLSKVLNCNYSDLTDIEKVKTLAESMAKMWKDTFAIDKTDMNGDFSRMHSYSKDVLKMESPHPSCVVVSEFLMENVEAIRNSLSYLNTDNPFRLQILHVIGHGLTEERAEAIRNSAVSDKVVIECWKWPLVNCEVDIGKPPEEVARNVEKGDIVVFASGFLSPNWVVDRLRERDQYSIETTVVIIFDSCYSGRWNERISMSLQEAPLRFTNVVVQTACRSDEESWGCVFTPSFSALQSAKDSEISNTAQAAYGDRLSEIQNPTFFCHEAEEVGHFSRCSSSGVVEVDTFGVKLRFFDDQNPEFFHKFVQNKIVEAARGIPDSDLKNFFDSFESEEKIRFLCYKLKKHSSGTPMALILIEWIPNQQEPPQWYHLHLHFDNFQNMKLTSVNHVDVISSTHQFYMYEELDGSKREIKYTMKAWGYVQKSKLISRCIAFVTETKWRDPTCWNMKKAEPETVIRSRSAMFEEIAA